MSPLGHNPYQAPATAVADPLESIAMPEAVERDIRNGWIAALISGSVTLIFVLLAMGGTSLYELDAWGLLDAALVFAMAYGIRRRSRTCAVILFLYFIQAKILPLTAGAGAASIPVALVFLYYFGRAVLGTFRYHRLRAASQ